MSAVTCILFPVIASVAFRNFKALRSAHLRLAPFNLIIGPNGSGKTSLIEAVLRLRTLAKLPVVPAGSGETGTGPMVGPEIVIQFHPPHDGLTARMSCVSEAVCDLLVVTPAGAPGWPLLQAGIARIRSYLLDHHAMAAPAVRAEGAELAGDGGNLAAVLAHLQAVAPVEFAALSAEALRLLPEFTRFDFLTLPDGRIELGLHLATENGGHRVAAENLSQGALYLLAMLTLAFHPAPPSVVCIEEIDRGVHPRLLREVRDLLYRLSYPASFGMARAPVQVIATTHSPYLLDLLREHPEEIVISHKHGLEAHFERLADRADLPELMREGSLGDMWYSGILGGVPDE